MLEGCTPSAREDRDWTGGSPRVLRIVEGGGARVGLLFSTQVLACNQPEGRSYVQPWTESPALFLLGFTLGT